MTLFELYNRNNTSYYDIEYSAMDLFGNTDTKNECYKFLQEHFERGKKYELLITDLYPEYQQNGKHIHSVSLFLLGKELLPHFRKHWQGSFRIMIIGMTMDVIFGTHGF